MFGLSYWFLPLFAACAWLGTLLAMICTWAAMGKPYYDWQGAPNQKLPYISDVAATSWGYPLFIAGSAVMVVVFDLAFISERWLRHRGRLAHNYNLTEKILSGFAIAFAIIGAAGLIVLTVWDTRRHNQVHNAGLVVFIGGYIISAIFICAEYQRLGMHFREYRILRASFWIKLSFIFVEVALVVAFAVQSHRGRFTSAAILEWIVSLVFIFYVLSFIIDFLPATRTRHHADRFDLPVRRSLDEDPAETEAAGNLSGGPVYTSGGHDGRDLEKTEPNGASKNF